jgi:Fe-S oxidoreductase/nitrate reductase gamma subunit
MYGVFLVCLIVFSIGLYRHLRSLGIGAAGGATFRDHGAARRSAREGLKEVTRRIARLVDFALLQRRVLRRRYSGWTHLTIFWGFVVLSLGSLTIMVDSYVLQPLGILLSRDLGFRIFQMSLDVFGLTLLGGVALAIHRRVWIKPEHTRPDRRTLVILCVLLGMVVSGFVLEGLRIRLEGSSEPWAFAGNTVAALIALASPSPASGMALYKVLWWSHAVVAFGLIAAVPYSPLRHILTSPLNILVSSGHLSGAMTTPFSLVEVMQSGRFDVKVGADSIDDLGWKERLALNACADFGGCQDVCPAHAAGTPLSPMQLVEDLRRVSDTSTGNGAGSRDLLNGAVSEDTIWSCTLCGACTQSCPTLVDPMGYIVQLRRGLVGKNRLGRERTGVLANLSYSRNPYGSSGAGRERLAAELGIPTLDQHRDVDLLYWVGCAATFDPRARAIATATVKILNAAGLRCAVIGRDESCCGDPARRIGEEGLFQELASRNIETISRYGINKVLTHCAHCFNTFRNEYPEFGAQFEVVHHGALIRDLIESGAIDPSRPASEPMTLHDSCYVGRFNGGVEHPRAVLRSIPQAALTEMPRSGERAFCCGAGGANYWYEVPRREKTSTLRLREAEATGARVLVTECPFCLKMFEDAIGSPGDTPPMKVRDIAEVVAEALGEDRET